MPSDFRVTVHLIDLIAWLCRFVRMAASASASFKLVKLLGLIFIVKSYFLTFKLSTAVGLDRVVSILKDEH